MLVNRKIETALRSVTIRAKEWLDAGQRKLKHLFDRHLPSPTAYNLPASSIAEAVATGNLDPKKS
jgi:hypothetical protein